ncbi:hypothetical protein [Actibacterium sp. 188UL27-1]|uniref:hypothetical protein n=1 Tax=Actibacterium sp. 188UL27-1 TaxID=2786961 RepID=UPI00195A55E3|nr:hypothetical protein [Actibacterium sp. 188UL27-1]MBM7066172.1 hypothetical protein [Actibacterium sp. 188UL27-1]
MPATAPWGDPPGFCIIQRSDVTLALDRGDAPAPNNQWWAAYIYVDDADALQTEFDAQNIETTRMHHPSHYGCIDFDVVDPDGHRIAFGQALSPDPDPGLNTDRGRG